MQTRWQSFFESCINVAIGYGVALLSQILVFPLFGIHIPLTSNLAIGAIFTVISIARSYAVRRVFNRLPERIARADRMPHSKMTPEMVAAARDRHSRGEKQKDLAAEYGVSVAQMSRIIRRTRWTHV